MSLALAFIAEEFTASDLFSICVCSSMFFNCFWVLVEAISPFRKQFISEFMHYILHIYSYKDFN